MMVFEGVTHWHWWALAGTLIAIEAFGSGFGLLWLGLAAGTAGLIVLLAPELPFAWQLMAFSALAVGSVLSWRAWQGQHPQTSQPAGLNQRGAGYVGRRVALVEPIVGGQGRARVADGSWAVRGPDLPKGTVVEVVGADGAVLLVQPVTRAAPSAAADAPGREPSNAPSLSSKR